MAAAINQQAMLDVLGQPEDVMRELERFSDDARVLSTRQSALIERYARRWIAILDGAVVASADSLQGVLAAADGRGLPRRRLVVRFIDRAQRTMIL